jgi:hypothetical protein
MASVSLSHARKKMKNIAITIQAEWSMATTGSPSLWSTKAVACIIYISGFLLMNLACWRMFRRLWQCARQYGNGQEGKVGFEDHHALSSWRWKELEEAEAPWQSGRGPSWGDQKGHGWFQQNERSSIGLHRLSVTNDVIAQIRNCIRSRRPVSRNSGWPCLIVATTQEEKDLFEGLVNHHAQRVEDYLVKEAALCHKRNEVTASEAAREKIRGTVDGAAM